MANIVYCLKKKFRTEELHLFKGVLNVGNSYSYEELSVCQKMHINENIEIKFSDKPEDIARTECAELGRQVCGTCVSNLYGDYK